MITKVARGQSTQKPLLLTDDVPIVRAAQVFGTDPCGWIPPVDVVLSRAQAQSAETDVPTGVGK